MSFFFFLFKGKLNLWRPIDREVNSRLQFTVSAADDGSPPLNSSITVDVNVLDSNDNTPTFVQGNFNFSIKENSDNTTLVTKLNATDADIAENANMTFFLADFPPFRINETTVSFSIFAL